MDTGVYEGTAKIYQFPLRGTVAADGRVTPRVMVEAMPQLIVNALDNCWYHDAAMQAPETN